MINCRNQGHTKAVNWDLVTCTVHTRCCLKTNITKFTPFLMVKAFRTRRLRCSTLNENWIVQILWDYQASLNQGKDLYSLNELKLKIISFIYVVSSFLTLFFLSWPCKFSLFLFPLFIVGVPYVVRPTYSSSFIVISQVFWFMICIFLHIHPVASPSFQAFF